MSWMLLLFVFGGLLQLVISKHSMEDIYCSKAALSWTHGMEVCQRINGSVVLDEDLLYNNIVADNVTIWTSSYTRKTSMTESQHKLCGFTYIDSSFGLWSGDILFGHCNSNKSYICQETNDTVWMIREGSYKEATECRHQHVSIFTYLKNTDTNITGYFWINKQLQQWELTLRGDVRFIFMPIICGMYNSNGGHYYGDCYKKLKTLCRLGNRHPDFDKACLVLDSSHSGPRTTSGYPQMDYNDNEFVSRNEISSTPLKSNITNITSSNEQPLYDDLTNNIDLKIGIICIFGVIVALSVILGFGFIYLTTRYRRTFTLNRDLSNETRIRRFGRFISSVSYSAGKV